MEEPKLISLQKQKQMICKHCEVYYEELKYQEHMLKAHQEIIEPSKEDDEQNYWCCPIHKKPVTFSKHCEECGGFIIIIKRNSFNEWTNQMQKLNDHSHKWIQSRFRKSWIDAHCLFCNNKPQDLGIFEKPNGTLIDYQGQEEIIDYN